MDLSDTEILVRRAQLLAAARPIDTTIADDADSERYLVAICGAERIAIRLTSVAEVYRPTGVTPLPRPRPPIWGLAAWRGRILTIAAIGGCAPDTGAGMVAVLTQGREVFAGVWVTDVEGEAAISGTEISAASGLSGVRQEFFTGMTADAVLLLDASGLKALLEREIPASEKGSEQNSTRNAG